MTTKISLLLNAVLIAALGMGIFKFIIQGSTAPSDDGRISILMSEGERNFVLAEMRGFLETVQIITAAIGDKDLATVSEVSREIAVDDPAKMPAGLKGKLPLEFKTLGMDTHDLFTDLAAVADSSGDPLVVTTALSELMENCIACHGSYRLDVDPEGS